MTRRIAMTCVLLCLTVGVSAALQQVDPKDSATIVRTTQADFQPLHAGGKVLVLDVREPHVFEAGRIPGAMSVPMADVQKRVAEIRTKAAGRAIVAYCSCQSEHTAAEALLILHNRGITNVSALAGGYSEWVRAGNRVEK